MQSAALGSPNGKSEAAILREELKQSQSNLIQWHESWKQAKQACEAWKKEAEEANAKARLEREDAIRRIEELELALREAENKMRIVQAQGPIRALAENAELARLPMSNLEQIQQLLRRDLERVEIVRDQGRMAISSWGGGGGGDFTLDSCDSCIWVVAESVRFPLHKWWL